MHPLCTAVDMKTKYFTLNQMDTDTEQHIGTVKGRTPAELAKAIKKAIEANIDCDPNWISYKNLTPEVYFNSTRPYDFNVEVNATIDLGEGVEPINSWWDGTKIIVEIRPTTLY